MQSMAPEEDYELLDLRQDENGWYARAWLTCRCGKQYMKSFRAGSEGTAKARLYVAARSPCAACAADAQRDGDTCPEVVWIEGGVSVCGREYHHDGKCIEPGATNDW